MKNDSLDFKAYWKALEAKKGRKMTDEDTINMSGKQFKKMQKQAFDLGNAHGQWSIAPIAEKMGDIVNEATKIVESHDQAIDLDEILIAQNKASQN